MTTKKIKVTKNGPYLVSGNVPLAKETIKYDEDGFPIGYSKKETIATKEDYALCRCGHSRNKPFCDGSHQATNFDGKETASKKTFDECAEITDGPKLLLKDKKDLCIGAGFCDRAEGAWQAVIDSDDPKSHETAIDECCNCPSGRLVLVDKATGKEIEPVFEESISLLEQPDDTSSALWVKGGIEIESADGAKYEKRNRVTLCRCGHSKNKPFCDGSHVEVNFNDKK